MDFPSSINSNCRYENKQNNYWKKKKLKNLAAGRVPMSWSNGLNGSPKKNVISKSTRSLRSEAKGA